MTESFAELFCGVFAAGGILMYPLAAIALYAYFCAFKTSLRLGWLNALCADEKSFAQEFVKFESENSAPDVKSAFARLRSELLSDEERRVKMLKSLAVAAPLVGLLGTVAGMTETIVSSASDSSAGVAEGISVALITTQAGLVVAIPAWIAAVFAHAQMRKLLTTLAARESSFGREAL